MVGIHTSTGFDPDVTVFESTLQTCDEDVAFTPIGPHGTYLLWTNQCHVRIAHSIAMTTSYLWSESLHYRIPSLFMCLHRLEPIQMFQYTWTHPHINYITFGTDCIDVHASNVINIGVFCLYFISVSIFISGAIRAIESCGCDDKDEQMNLLYFMIITLSY
eukprot:128007_1